MPIFNGYSREGFYLEYQSINQLKLGEGVLGFYLIKAVEYKTTNTNKKFLDLVLSDKTGTIRAKLWDATEEMAARYSAGVLVKIKGLVTEWQNQLQLRIEKIRLTTPEDRLNIEDYVPSAPYSPEFMYNEILKYVSRVKNQDIYRIVSCILDKNREKLLRYPAAKKNHHSIRSGLLYHIYTMLKAGEKLSEIYTLINPDLLYAGIILHDIAKIEEMTADELGLVTDYTVPGQLLGHLVLGVKQIALVAQELGADEEVALLLQHMLLAHHSEPEMGSPVRPKIPEAELLHYLDLIDARMYDMAKALENVAEGEFTPRIWVLDNRSLYKAPR